MSLETNKLVGKVGRFGAPAGAAVALVLAATFFFHHNGVHAAMISSPAPMDDNSVSALVFLDNAVEAVATRVSPSVVTIQVTSHASSEHETGGGQNQILQRTVDFVPLAAISVRSWSNARRPGASPCVSHAAMPVWAERWVCTN